MNMEEAVTKSYLIPGWMWPAELCWLYNNFQPSMRHVEIGSFCGKSLYASCGGMSDESQVWAVDPLLLSQNTPSQGWVKSILIATMSHIRQRVYHIEKTSLDAARLLSGDEKFDSVFIDGSHHYADCLADIPAWMPLVKPGGIIAGHDYISSYIGVMDAVNESFPDGFSVAPETRIWFKRLPVA